MIVSTLPFIKLLSVIANQFHLKLPKFIINSNIFIAIAAVSLTLATQAQLGLHPRIHAYHALIFFAVVLDYNFHRFMKMIRFPGTFRSEKYEWASGHVFTIKVLIGLSLAGLAATLFFVSFKTYCFLGLLAAITVSYSLPVHLKRKYNFRITESACMKSILISLVWTAATIFIVILNDSKSFNTRHLLLLSIERFLFIFAITIPFDIRDTADDIRAGIRTIPIIYGPERAMQISNIAMISALIIAIGHYLTTNMMFIALAFFVSVASTLFFTNSKQLKLLPFYYHVILDSCIVLHGILICASYFL